MGMDGEVMSREVVHEGSFYILSDGTLRIVCKGVGIEFDGGTELSQDITTAVEEVINNA
jgi:hypothetical protein